MRRWVLERRALGELPSRLLPETQRDVDALTAEQLSGLARENDAFFTKHPAELVVPRIRARAAEVRPARRPLGLGLGLALAAAAATVVVLVVVKPDDSGERLKGLTPTLSLFRKSGESSERLSEGAAAKGGDVLQLQYIAAGHGYGAIVSIDGQGQVTQHHPDPNGEPKLHPSGAVTLPFAYQLDEAPGFETFYFVTSDQPFAVDQVLAAAREAARLGRRDRPLELPPGFQQYVFPLMKVTP